MIITDEQRREFRRISMRYLRKHPVQLCQAAWRRMRFMWWITGNCRPQGVRQTKEIRFWYGVRRLLRRMPEAGEAYQKAAP